MPLRARHVPRRRGCSGCGGARVPLLARNSGAPPFFPLLSLSPRSLSPSQLRRPICHPRRPPLLDTPCYLVVCSPSEFLHPLSISRPQILAQPRCVPRCRRVHSSHRVLHDLPTRQSRLLQLQHTPTLRATRHIGGVVGTATTLLTTLTN